MSLQVVPDGFQLTNHTSVGAAESVELSQFGSPSCCLPGAYAEVVYECPADHRSHKSSADNWLTIGSGWGWSLVAVSG
jgi:hypothetical protein